ncbi:hypothetical protein [Actinokineospora sp.]|uniref:hypothetical protein n=1 Tax=Actinokineospora sp. TaxID=1872133 RepID=UPI0040377A28
MAKAAKSHRVDPDWAGDDDHGTHPVSELTSDRQGAMSPFGDLAFPLDSVPYEHPVTEINR